MVVIQLQGGLGNQMFQYALGRSLEARGKEVVFDRSPVDSDPKRFYTLNAFNTSVKFSNSNYGNVVYEKSMEFDHNWFSVDNCIINGYWQCEDYFSAIAPIIRQEFGLKNKPSDRAKEVAEQILEAEDDSVFVHVRRGDNCYGAGLTYHGLLGPDYYQRASKYIYDRVEFPKFFIFSDDTKWCKESYHGDSLTKHCVEIVEDTKDYEDIWLMSICKYAITANSSFSWWGAWLGNKYDVIAPKKWYLKADEGDTVPKRWIRL